MSVFQMVAVFLRSLLRTQTELTAENLALRQQLAILEHNSKRPRLRKPDRIFWAWLSRLWPNWRSALLIVQPETVVRWHQQGFKLYWRWKSQSRKPGRPKIDAEIRKLIRRMSLENPFWGPPPNPIGTPTPWLRGVEGYCGQVQGLPPQAAIANVANVPGQPCSRHRGG